MKNETPNTNAKTAGSDKPAQTMYHLLHAINPTFREIENRDTLNYDDFALVGMIWATVLEDLFCKTNHIDAPWHEKAKADIELLQAREDGRPPRSTSVGDLAIDNEGVIWCCAVCGWKELK